MAAPTQFVLPVDSEHKATRMNLLSFANPHMRAFQLSWIAFFTVFFSTFGPASMLPVIRQSLNMTKTELGNAGIAAVCGAIASRVLLGNFLDILGPRYGLSIVLLFTAPPVFCIGLVTDAAGFVVCRLFIGIGLAAFVACQFWCSSMFNTKIVGTANAIAAGWGNMGGGATHFILPLVLHALEDNYPSFQAWRWTFVLPGLMHVVMGAAVLLFSQDLPDGDYRELKAAGLMNKPKSTGSLKAALTNYRTWIMTLTYGYCFGVELTLDNVISQYLFDTFSIDLHTAGMLGSVFGMMNLFSRAMGGVFSDYAARYFGMRGRLWVHWFIQSLGGVFCCCLALVDYSLGATMAIIVVFSFFCQAACGTSFGIVPFISKRGLGQVSGMVGAGGNAGSAVTQALFFTNNPMSTQDGFKWMGVMTLAVTALTFLVYFPMWGGMFLPAKEGVTEEDYYLAEYSAEERAQGMHSASLKFAYESKSERGWAKGAEAQAAVDGKPTELKTAAV